MALEQERDEDLLARFVAERDEAAFETLVRRHEDRIFALAFRLTRDRSDALDATQDTFVAAFRRAGSFKGEASFGTWLYSIGLNACRDLLRKRKRLPVPDSDRLVADRGPVTPSSVERVESRVDLAAALQQLPEDYRTAVALHDLGGFPYDEIARITEANIGTVKSRISRGRRKLAAIMEQPAPAESSKD